MVELKFDQVEIPREVPLNRLLKREVRVGSITINGEQFVVLKSKLNFGTLVFTQKQWGQLFNFIQVENKPAKIPKTKNTFSDFLEL